LLSRAAATLLLQSNTSLRCINFSRSVTVGYRKQYVIFKTFILSTNDSNMYRRKLIISFRVSLFMLCSIFSY
jgi:hypothetical protein